MTWLIVWEFDSGKLSIVLYGKSTAFLYFDKWTISCRDTTSEVRTKSLPETNASRMYSKGDGVEQNVEIAAKYKKKVFEMEKQLRGQFKPIEMERGSWNIFFVNFVRKTIIIKCNISKKMYNELSSQFLITFWNDYNYRYSYSILNKLRNKNQ